MSREHHTYYYEAEMFRRGSRKSLYSGIMGSPAEMSSWICHCLEQELGVEKLARSKNGKRVHRWRVSSAHIKSKTDAAAESGEDCFALLHQPSVLVTVVKFIREIHAPLQVQEDEFLKSIGYR